MKVCGKMNRKTGTWLYTTRKGITYVFGVNEVCYDMTEDEFNEIKSIGIVDIYNPEFKSDNKEKVEEVVVEKKKKKKKKSEE